MAAERLRRSLAQRGIGARVLAGAAVASAMVAAVLFALHYPVIGAIVGLLALAASELSSGAAPEVTPDATHLPAALRLPVDLLIAAGIVAGLATTAPVSPALVLLGLLVLGLVAWLPHLKAIAPNTRLAPDAGIWRRPERLGILLLGALLGRMLPALLLVALVGALDAWVRLDRLDDAGSGGPPFLRPLLQADGRLVPAVRWGTLAIATLILLVLPPGQV